VLSAEGLAQLGQALGLPSDPAAAARVPAIEALLLGRVNDRLARFPGYARILRIAVTDTPWSIDAGLITPTMKLCRARIAEQHRAELAELYAGHD